MTDRDPARSGASLPEILAALAVLLVLAPILVLAFPRSTCRDYYGVQCANHLKQIYGYALAYAEKSGTGGFPVAPANAPRAHDPLNELIAFDPEGLLSSLFVCSVSDSIRAEPDADGRFLLSESTTSYAWTTEPLDANGPPRPLASDKYVDGFEDADGRHSGHRGGMNVLYTDGSVQFVLEKDLDPRTGLPPGLAR